MQWSLNNVDTINNSMNPTSDDFKNNTKYKLADWIPKDKIQYAYLCENPHPYMPAFLQENALVDDCFCNKYNV